MKDILERLAHSSANESSHELQCRCFDAAEEISRLRSLLRRGLKQLAQWQEKYGEFDPEWIPPAGDVRWVEDADDALTPNAALTGTRSASELKA